MLKGGNPIQRAGATELRLTDRRARGNLLLHLLMLLHAGTTVAATFQAPTVQVCPTPNSLPAGAVARLGDVFFRHPSPVLALEWLRPSNRLMSVGDDGSINVWDIRNRAMNEKLRFRRLDPERGILRRITSICLSPSQHWLAFGGEDGRVSLLDLASRSIVHEIDTVSGEVSSLEFAPDNAFLLSGHERLICGWAVPSGKKLFKLETTGTVRSLGFTRSGTGLIALVGRSIVKWKVRDDGGPSPYDVSRLGEGDSMVISPDRTRLAVAGTADNSPQGKEGSKPRTTIQVFEPVTGRFLRAIPTQLQQITSIGFSPDGRAVAIGSKNGVLGVLRLDSRDELFHYSVHCGRVNAVLWSREGNVVFTASEDCTVGAWDGTSGNDAISFRGHRGAVKWCALSTDGMSVSSAGDDSVLRTWDIVTGEQLGAIGESGEITFLAHSPKRFSTAVGLKATIPEVRLVVWERKGNNTARTLRPPPNWRWCSELHNGSFSPDGTMLAACCIDYQRRKAGIIVWSAVTGQIIFRDERPSFWHATSAVFHPDRKRVIVAYGDGRIVVFGILTGKEETSLTAPDYPVYGVAMSPDGGLLVSWDANGSVHYWDISARRLLETRHVQSDVRCCTFSDDGAYMYFGDEKGNLSVCEACSLEVILCLRGHEGPVSSIGICQRGRRVVSASLDGTLLVWDIPLAFKVQHRHPLDGRPEEIASLWKTLGSQDARRANNALWRMVERPCETIPFLRRRLVPSQVSEEELSRLIGELDSANYTVRRDATEKLRALAPEFRQLLMNALERNNSPESRARLQEIVGKQKPPRIDEPEILRSLRAIRTLELIGDAEARNVLRTIANGTPSSVLTRWARASSERLAFENLRNH